jgi:hypothetical protein
MTDETRPGNQDAPTGGTPEGDHEAQRNLPQILDEAAHKVMDGTIQAAAGYAAKVIIDKVKDRRPPGGEPPAQDPGPADNLPS